MGGTVRSLATPTLSKPQTVSNRSHGRQFEAVLAAEEPVGGKHGSRLVRASAGDRRRCLPGVAKKSRASCLNPLSPLDGRSLGALIPNLPQQRART